ncbi:MAG: peptide deformylase [Coriobacteriia bacterium]|nr:peptide deformylase [Coriobacteriia bacterium]
MEILSHPSPALHSGADDVDPLEDVNLLELVKVMARTMYDAPGVGLAAPQIGVLKRVIVYDVEEGNLVALCNPHIVRRSEETVIEDEGCLSVPGITIPIERSATVTCEAVDLGGNTVTIEASELLARVLQHEVDHLDGVLIIDRASPEEKKAALRRYAEASAAVR